MTVDRCLLGIGGPRRRFLDSYPRGDPRKIREGQFLRKVITEVGVMPVMSASKQDQEHQRL